MSLLYSGLSTLLLHAGPVTSTHWWAEWRAPILSAVITLLLVGIATIAYLIEKRRLA